jgi:phytoene dehydrogenase-like protein
MEYDAVVVGGGMAGLTAAAYLSKAGKTVLLCEKEQKVGGLVNSFERSGFVFDGGIRAIENSGIVLPMLRQLGIDIEFLPSTVSIGIGDEVMRVSTEDSLADNQALLERQFPENKPDIARIIAEVRRVMDYLDVVYGIDNPLFLDLKSDPRYLVGTVLPWMLK